MIILDSPEKMRAWRRSHPVNSQVGLVPTMGALHEGHASLLRRMRERCNARVLSIFVNPAQFGPSEDLARYPRPIERDLEIAAQEGVDGVFLPTPDQMYPEGYSTYLDENRISVPLCGHFRPGHFRGVATIVLKLFHLVQPHLAFFGLKDAQQFLLLRKIVQDLNLDLEIEGIPTVRESDGLALSSRNLALSPQEREKAPLLYQVLQETQSALERNFRQNSKAPGAVLLTGRNRLEAEGFRGQYLDCLQLPELTPLTPTLKAENQYLLAVAATLGKTRLIDNVFFELAR